jgi:hypothetical protein
MGGVILKPDFLYTPLFLNSSISLLIVSNRDKGNSGFEFTPLVA